MEVQKHQTRKWNLGRLEETSGPSSEEPSGSAPSFYANEVADGVSHARQKGPSSILIKLGQRCPSRPGTEAWEKLFSVPELGFDVTGAGGAVLHLLLLLLPQDALGQQVVGGCDVVVLVGLQGSERTVT